MTYKPQSIPGQPDSVIKHEKFSDLMQRYHGQMENALYAAEQICAGVTEKECPGCSWSRGEGYCLLPYLRRRLGDHVPQHDIQIPEDDTQEQRKRER